MMKEFFTALLSIPLFRTLFILAGIIICVAVLLFIIDFILYYKTEYYRSTKIPFLILRFNRTKDGLGRYGEFLLYVQLRPWEKYGAKFLFNVNIPKANQETTELDVVMVYKRGINVFESKNFSGWIFADELSKYWCQTLPAGKGKSAKNYFYNPIKQNKAHIEHLRAFLETSVPIRSLIIFSSRCEFKVLNYNRDENVHVLKRSSIFKKVKELSKACSEDVLNEEQINEIYNKLLPLSAAGKKE